jgi:hypothetical protein
MCLFVTSCAGRDDDKRVHIKFAVRLFPIIVVKERNKCGFCKFFLSDVYCYGKRFVDSCLLIIEKNNSGIVLPWFPILSFHKL